MTVDFNAELIRLKQRLRQLNAALESHLCNDLSGDVNPSSRDMNSNMSQAFGTTEEVPFWIIVAELMKALAEAKVLLDLDANANNAIEKVYPGWPKEIGVLKRLCKESQSLFKGFDAFDREKFDTIVKQYAETTITETVEGWAYGPSAEQVFELEMDFEYWNRVLNFKIDPDLGGSGGWNDSMLWDDLKRLAERLNLEGSKAGMLPEQKKLLGKYLRRLRLNSLVWLDNTTDSDSKHPNYTNNPDYTSVRPDWVKKVIGQFDLQDPDFADQMATEQLLNDIAERIDLDGYNSFTAWMKSPLPAAKIRSGVSFIQIPPPIKGGTTGCAELLLALTFDRRPNSPPGILKAVIKYLDSPDCSGVTKRVVVFLTNWDSREIDKEAPGVFDRIDQSITSGKVHWSFLVLNPGMRSVSRVDYKPRQP